MTIGLASPFLAPAIGEPFLPLEDINEQVWVTERARSGKQPFQWIEIEVDRCRHTYGSAPCTASLDENNPAKCVNGWATCQDKANFASEPFWVRVCEAVADIPRAFDFGDEPGTPHFIPLLRNAEYAPGMPEPGETLGMRASLTASFNDAPHHDIGLDKYALQRVTGEAAVSAGEVFWDFRTRRLQPVHGGELATVSSGRASDTGTFMDISGVLHDAHANVERFDWATWLACPTGGLLVEVARTNPIRNNTMQGAVPGSPGTPPTNWGVTVSNPELSITQVGTFVENGIEYVEYRFNGTVTASRTINIRFDTTTGIAALDAQVWASSFFARIVGGGLTNITGAFSQINTYDAGGVFVNQPTNDAITLSTDALKTERHVASATLSGGTIAFVLPWLSLVTATSGAVAITLRIGLPQMERPDSTPGGLASSPIRTTGASVTRNADNIRVDPANFLEEVGTFVVDFAVQDAATAESVRVISLNDGTASNRFDLLMTHSTDLVLLQSIVGGVAEFNNSIGPYAPTRINRVAFSFNAAGCRASLNGANAETIAGAVCVELFTRFDLGGLFNNVHLGGHLFTVTSYPYEMSNAQLEALAGTLAPAHSVVPFENAFNPDQRSSFIRKLRVRYPHYIGRRLRWWSGYITADPTRADFRRRDYVMERWEGPDNKGQMKITSKDPLKLLDDQRAQAPRKSVGTLLAALDEASTPTDIDVVTNDLTEYDLRAGETEDYVVIGGEVITYTTVTVIDATTVRLSGLTFAAPSPYLTEREDHDAGDEVQRCRYFSGTVPEVVRELMIDFGELDAAYVPFDEWEAEFETWLAGQTVQRLVVKPEGIKSLVNEIIEQTQTWAFWFDDVRAKILYRAMRPADFDDVVKVINDDGHLVADSVRVNDAPDKVVNEVQVLYDQIDPTKPKGETNNYRKGIAAIDADSQSSNETAQRRIKRLFATWQPGENSVLVQRHAQRTLTSRKKNAMTIQFQLERKDEDISVGAFADLTTIYLVDALGLPRTTRLQVTRVDATGELVNYTAREEYFANQFGRWAPVELTGLSWLDATDEQRAKYLFWADADGFFSNGDPGKFWL